MQDLQTKNHELLHLANHFSQEVRFRLLHVLNVLNSKAAQMKLGPDGCADLTKSTQELLSMIDNLAQEQCDIVNYASNHHFVKMLNHVETAIKRAYVNILAIILRMSVQMLRIINKNEVMELEDKMPSFTELDNMIFEIAERLESLTLDE